MIYKLRNKNFTLKFFLFPLLTICSFSLWGQVDSGYDLSKSNLTQSSGVSSKYSYDPETGMYYYTESIDGYPINTPLVISQKEFEAMECNFLNQSIISSFLVDTGSGMSLKYCKTDIAWSKSS